MVGALCRPKEEGRGGERGTTTSPPLVSVGTRVDARVLSPDNTKENPGKISWKTHLRLVNGGEDHQWGRAVRGQLETVDATHVPKNLLRRPPRPDEFVDHSQLGSIQRSGIKISVVRSSGNEDIWELRSYVRDPYRGLHCARVNPNPNPNPLASEKRTDSKTFTPVQITSLGISRWCKPVDKPSGDSTTIRKIHTHTHKHTHLRRDD